MTSIAQQFGFASDTLWNHPQNAALKLARKDLNVLFPGDAVFIPDKQVGQQSAATDAVYTYKLNGAPAKLRLRVLVNGEPRADDRYVLVVDSKTSNGVTDSDGRVEESIAPNAQKGTLTFPSSGESFSLQLGHLDPVAQVSGIQARLRGLGLYAGDITGTLDQDTKSGIAAFQKLNNLPESGDTDQATQDALQAAFGS